MAQKGEGEFSGEIQAPAVSPGLQNLINGYQQQIETLEKAHQDALALCQHYEEKLAKTWQPTDDYDCCVYMDGGSEVWKEWLPDDIRLCRLVESPQAPVPPDVLDEIEMALTIGRQLAHSPVHLITFDRALALLESLQGGS